MANQTLDNILFFSNTYGQICANDSNHQIAIRADRNGTAGDYTNYYQHSGTLASGLGHKFWTGGVIGAQTLKFHIADDGNSFACKVGIGIAIPCATLHVAGAGATMRLGPYYADTDRDYLFFEAGGTNSQIITRNESMTIHNCGGPLILNPSGQCVGIGTTSAPMALTFTDSLGGKILFNNNQNNYSIGLASGVVSADSSMKFMAGCTTPGDFTFYRGSSLSMIITCAGNMGIGTAAPTSKLDVCGADGKIQSRVDSSDGSTINVRPNAGKCGWISYTEDAVADRWGIGVKNGDAKLYFSSGNVSSGGGTTRMIIDGGGCVGINTTSPTYRLHVNGTFYAAGSSQDYKQSICNYNTDSCMFMKLKPVTYQYKEEYCHLGKELKSGTQIGLIAEEVAESHPELAILVNEEDNKVVRNVDYEKLTIILLSELQKLRQEVDQLKNK